MSDSDLVNLLASLARLTHVEHTELGVAGKKDHGINRFGDRTLRAGEEAEQTIVSVLQGCDYSMRRIAKALGEFTALNAEYTLFVDGLNGSKAYKRTPWDCIAAGQGRYATMFALYAGTEPHYRNAIMSCIVEHPTKRLVIASEDKCWIEHLNDAMPVQLAQTSQARLSSGSLIYCGSEDDAHWDQLPQTEVITPLAQAGYTVAPANSAAQQYVDVATGVAAASVRWTGRDNLELAVARQIINNAGGEVTTLDGRYVADLTYDSFGHDPDDAQIVIAAANGNVTYEIQCILTGHP